MSPVFTFDAVEHAYYLDAVRIPGVTSILKSQGLVPMYGGFGEAQHRGTVVHLATEYLDLNDLDWDHFLKYTPQYAGYVRAWDRFKKESGFVPELIEYQTYHPIYRYAGTIDRRGRMNGEIWQLDIKTGIHSEWWQLQTGGYKLLRPEWEQDRRGAVQLFEDGTYKLHPHNDDNDPLVFLSSLALYNWKSNHKIKQEAA